MKLADIKTGSVLRHISDNDYNHPPQKLIVVRINQGAQEEWEDGDTVYCEWLSKTGKFHKEWLNHHRLEKW